MVVVVVVVVVAVVKGAIVVVVVVVIERRKRRGRRWRSRLEDDVLNATLSNSIKQRFVCVLGGVVRVFFFSCKRWGGGAGTCR